MIAGAGDDPPEPVPTDAIGTADGADALLRDARSFVADEAALLAGLSGVLDELAEAEAAEADAFDTDAMWARVQRQLWPDEDAPGTNP